MGVQPIPTTTATAKQIAFLKIFFFDASALDSFLPKSYLQKIDKSLTQRDGEYK
jgi:hypothetical protein